jgi:hypothetical protein
VATGDVPSYLPSHTQSTLHTTPFLRTTHQKKNLYKNIKKEIKRIISICGGGFYDERVYFLRSMLCFENVDLHEVGNFFENLLILNLD